MAYNLPPGFGQSLVNELGSSGPTTGDPVVRRAITGGSVIGQAQPAPTTQPDFSQTGAPDEDAAPIAKPPATSATVAPATTQEVAATSSNVNTGATGQKLLETINKPSIATRGVTVGNTSSTDSNAGTAVSQVPPATTTTHSISGGASTSTAGPGTRAIGAPETSAAPVTGASITRALNTIAPEPAVAPPKDLAGFVNGFLNQRNPATGMFYTMKEIADMTGVPLAELQPFLDYAQQTNLEKGLSAGTAEQNPLANINANILKAAGQGFKPAAAGEEGSYMKPLPTGSSTTATGDPPPPISGDGSVSDLEGQQPGNLGPNLPKGKGPAVQYFGPDGKPYSGSGNSYWFNEAENTWYMGDPSGKVTNIGQKAPWDTTGGGKTFVPGQEEKGPSRVGGRLLSLIDAFTGGRANEDLARSRQSQLTEQLRSAHTADQQRMAEALLARGISGGQALSSLGGLEQAYAKGLSGGLAGIQQQMLEEGNQQRQQALEALLQMDTADRKNALEQMAITINEKLQNREMDISEAQGWQKLINELMQIDLQNEVQQGELGLKSKALDIGTITDLLTLAQSLSGKEQQTILDILPWLLGEQGNVDLGGD